MKKDRRIRGKEEINKNGIIKKCTDVILKKKNWLFLIDNCLNLAVSLGMSNL